MRRREHERIVGILDRENRRLREENRELRDRLMYALGTPWTPPPPDPELDEQNEVEHEDPDFPYMTSNPELTGV